MYMCFYYFFFLINIEIVSYCYGFLKFKWNLKLKNLIYVKLINGFKIVYFIVKYMLICRYEIFFIKLIEKE